MNKPFGKFTLTERLGGGGMAEVFRAVMSGPQGFEKQLAIKLILPHVSDDPEFVRMFIHEATLAVRLTHTNIVAIQDFDQVEGRYFIAMELVDGYDLRQFLLRSQELNRPLHIDEVLIITLEICKGLSYAHGELTPGADQIIHRDISPHNVIVSQAGEVKITDFGIAKMTSGANMTHTGTVKGKLAYMSPEQAEGKELDKRTDLFSLGCMLWEMLTGLRLFAAQNDMAILNKLKYGPIRPPSEHNSQVSPELDQLVLHCLARDREKRISSASELARRTDQILQRIPNVDRQTALVMLYQSLFGSKSRKTEVMPAGPPVGAEPRESNAVIEEPPPSHPPVAETILRAESKPRTDQQHRLDQKLQASPKRLLWIGITGAGFIVVVGLSMFFFQSGFNHTPFKQNQPDTKVGADQTALDEHQSARETQPISTNAALGADRPTGKKLKPNSSSAPEQVVRSPAGLSENPQVEEGSQIAPTDHLPPPKQKPPKAAKSAKYGRLFLNVWPAWAKVYWGKQYLGDTPVENVKLPQGWHTIILVNQELGLKRTVRVKIKAGKNTKKSIQIK